MQSIRIIEIPKCKMVSFGIGMFGQEKFERFNAWFSALPRQAYPHDFLFWGEENEDFSMPTALSGTIHAPRLGM